jgi:hypothetical protein
MAISARRVDPRDERWEVNALAYRVYLWEADQRCDEWEVAGCDVEEALKWAHRTANQRTFTLYACAVSPDGLGLIRLTGDDRGQTYGKQPG